MIKAAHVDPEIVEMGIHLAGAVPEAKKLIGWTCEELQREAVGIDGAMRDHEPPPADPPLLAALAQADLDELSTKLLGRPETVRSTRSAFENGSMAFSREADRAAEDEHTRRATAFLACSHRVLTRTSKLSAPLEGPSVAAGGSPQYGAQIANALDRAHCARGD